MTTRLIAAQRPVGILVRCAGEIPVFSLTPTHLADGSRAVVLLNRGANETPISVGWHQIGYPDHLAAEVRDLWAHKDLGKFTGSFKAVVPSHAVVMVTIKP